MVERHLNPKEFEEVKYLPLAEYNKLQIDHILIHKWYLSEEQKREVSFNEATKDWIKSGLAVEFRSKFKIIPNHKQV